ncbi:hypothetical protein BV25DRAFT_179739 [Artomyces pyxidatus]|uniref:Uncharacterized protein n=1 Tax=Artomyces pyxidatus TaxID=48021 RepID=A0ACB8SGI2_9AGAM|nr:hypothetical protein BV25DRAFT_179739 [Artomyces pyxidatus]
MLPYSRYPTAADHRYGDANPEHSPHTHQPTYWTPYADAYNAGTQYPMQQQDAYAHSPIAEGYGQPHASSYAQSACRRDDSPSNAHSAMSSQINYTAPPYDFREFPAPQYAEPQYPNHHVDPPYHQYGISPAPHPAYFAEGAYPSQSYPSSTPFPKLNLYEPTDVRSSSEPRPEQQFPDHMHYRYGDDPPTPQQSTPSPVAPRSTGLTGPINTRFYSPSSQFRKHKIYESSEYDARSPASELSNATYPPASDYDPQSPPEPHLIQQFPSDPYSYVELPRHAVPPVTKQSTSSELGNALQEPLPPPRKFVSPPREPMVRSQSTSSMPSERAPSPPMDHLPFPEDAEQKERLESAVRKQFDGIVGTRKKVGSNADHKQVVQSPSTASQSEPIQHDHPEGVACTHSDAVAPTPTRGPPPLAHAHTAPLPIPTKPLTPVLPPPPHRESFYLVQDPAAYPEFAALRKVRVHPLY